MLPPDFFLVGDTGEFWQVRFPLSISGSLDQRRLRDRLRPYQPGAGPTAASDGRPAKFSATLVIRF